MSLRSGDTLVIPELRSPIDCNRVMSLGVTEYMNPLGHFIFSQVLVDGHESQAGPCILGVFKPTDIDDFNVLFESPYSNEALYKLMFAGVDPDYYTEDGVIFEVIAAHDEAAAVLGSVVPLMAPVEFQHNAGALACFANMLGSYLPTSDTIC